MRGREREGGGGGEERGGGAGRGRHVLCNRLYNKVIYDRAGWGLLARLVSKNDFRIYRSITNFNFFYTFLLWLEDLICRFM